MDLALFETTSNRGILFHRPLKDSHGKVVTFESPTGEFRESFLRMYIQRIDMSDELVTIRVPRHLKKRMKRSKVNWSQELRSAIEHKLATDDRKSAVHELDSIITSVKSGFDTTRAIKETRRLA
jgi:hypothetical protein